MLKRRREIGEKELIGNSWLTKARKQLIREDWELK
jgi:hypothetical protein